LWLDSAARLAYNAASVSTQERTITMHLDKQMTDLKFNVAQLLREEVGARRNYTFSENALPLDDEMILRQLEGKVRFTRTVTGVLADADAQGVVELPCIRCLNPAHQRVSIHFQDEFHSRIEVNTGMPLPKPSEDDPFFIDESHLVDLGEALREYALIELPMQPLCRPDCKGLCPNCGADRNLGECGCVNDETDGRFAVLKNLLNE
jgi:uncharacterized protein